jgi:hypothetical protein
MIRLSPWGVGVYFYEAQRARSAQIKEDAMRKQMVQCEDGRRRQARVYGEVRQDGDFEIWRSAVRVKGKHVSGEAWHSLKSKIWYFLTYPEGKNSHLLYRSRENSIKKMQRELETLKARHSQEWDQLAEQRKKMAAIETEIKTLEKNIAKLEQRVPAESTQTLVRSRHVRTR